MSIFLNAQFHQQLRKVRCLSKTQMADLTVKSRSMNALVIWFTAMFLIIAEECYGQEPFWETEEDIYESKYSGEILTTNQAMR